MTEPVERRPDPPVLGRYTVAVMLVCAPAIAAGVLVADTLRELADRSAIPARWRMPLLGAACLALAGVAALVWRWTVAP